MSVPVIDGSDPDGRTGALLSGDGWAAVVDRDTGLVVAFANNPDGATPVAASDAAWWILWS
jgi:hypothetical protein